MNRLEQIIEASKANIKKREDEIFHVYDHYGGFIEGAEWADKTMIDKACEWLENELFVVNKDDDYFLFTDSEKRKFIKDFKKAMKGDEEDD